MKITAILISISIICNTVYAQPLSQEKVKWYPFVWEGDEDLPKDAMLLYSTIDTVNFTFKWQFDTGSPRTFFYGNPWRSFCNTFPLLKTLFTTVDTLKADGYINVKNGGINIDGQKLPSGVIGVMPDYGNLIDKQLILDNLGAATTIGTMGIDLFRQGVLIIDFKDNRLGFTERLSPGFYSARHNTLDFMLYKNRIIIPVQLGRTTYYFFYDSGASLFPLKTTAAFTTLAGAVHYTDTLYNITTWGKAYNVPGGTLKQKLNIGNLRIKQPKMYVHPDPDKYHTEIFKEAETMGLIGNAFFDNRMLVIDFTKMKFTIL